MDGGIKELQFLPERLIAEDEFNRFMNSDIGGKTLKWVNYFQPITDHSSA